LKVSHGLSAVVSVPENEHPPPSVLTIGHSTRTLEEFIGLLKAHAVERVVDVRTVPRSRHNPQFNRETLPASLNPTGIGYIHMAGLGGLRRPRPNSVNTGLTNDSFRGFADHMETREFAASLEELIKLSKKERVALMCAEAVPWRCHRSLIADVLVARGIPTEHIISATRRDPHSIRRFATVIDGLVRYPSQLMVDG
jgi:uncharacterized protein (DUF488 family)